MTRTEPHLLTLTTTPSRNGTVIKQTLTVRDTDFHAVDRIIDLRDGGTVEIAELNYDLLPWGAVNRDWFEPISQITATDAPGILPAIALRAPRVLSNLELDEAEVEARFALNQLHADAGERIRVTRGPEGIDVKGVVDTDARKRELATRLSQLPHVQASILSVEELDNQPRPAPAFDASQPLRVYSVEAQSPPLEQYLRKNNQPLDQLSSSSQSLLDGALRMQQAQVNFSELQPRFGGADQLPVGLQNQLTELSRSYLEAIDAGLDSNRRTLRSLGFDEAIPPQSEAGSADDDLNEQILRYQQLCQEMIISNTSQTRSATAIARDLMNLTARIRLRIAQLSATVPKAHD